VGYIQGDDSLIGPVGASTKSKFTNISASLAPAVQGTAAYTLTAFTRSGREIASNSVIVTQDTGEPGTEPFGYFTVALGPLPTRAGSFRISNRFIRSSYSHITLIDFGVASLSWSG
jgi:hypothetical protein